MSEGTYICPERVERDGYLVAFEGEVMSMDEAVKRGLVTHEPEPEEPGQEPEKQDQEPAPEKPRRKTTRKASK